jgi:hypothetical protein
MSNGVEIAAVTLTLFAYAVWIAYHVSVARELRAACRETSRFPLFAARTQLVLLVANGYMSENDAAWRLLYGRTNNLLSLRRDLTLLDLFLTLSKHLVRLREDDVYRKRVDETSKREAEAATRVPEFGVARANVHRAVEYLMTARTRRWHIALVMVLLRILYVAVLAIRVGPETARSVGSALAKREGLRTFGSA